MTTAYPYYYSWKNNPKRASLYGRKLRVIARTGKMNSAVVRFGDTGQMEVISRNAIRKGKEGNNANIKGGCSRVRRGNI